MTVKEQLLPLLEQSGEQFLSGAEIAARLNVSRNAVHKAITALKEDGYLIEAVTNRGYRLSGESDVLSAAQIGALLDGLSDRLAVTVKPLVTSTLTVIKEDAENGAPEGTVLVAAEQTAGRGRFSRSFFSPPGSGIYLSILLRPRIPATDAVLITTAAAVAVARAAEELSGRTAEIKWVNDVNIDGKKICGILTEAALDLESGSLRYAAVGIGINVYEPECGFPDEIKERAGAVFERRAGNLKNRLAAAVLKYFFYYYDTLEQKAFLADYRKRCTVPGKQITVLSGERAVPALALDVDDACRLHVRYQDGTEDYLSSGEISIRL